MENIYVVTSGQWEDYVIESAFIRLDEALEFIKKLGAREFLSPVRVERFRSGDLISRKLLVLPITTSGTEFGDPTGDPETVVAWKEL